MRVRPPGAGELTLLGIFRAVLPQGLEIAYIPCKRYLEWHGCLRSSFFSLSAFHFIQCKLTSISAILACFCGDWSQLKTQYSAILLAASQVQSPCCSGTAVRVQKWHFFGFFILKIMCRPHDAHKMSGTGDSNTSERTALVSFAPCLNSSTITRLNTVSSCLALCVCVCVCVCVRA